MRHILKIFNLFLFLIIIPIFKSVYVFLKNIYMFKWSRGDINFIKDTRYFLNGKNDFHFGVIFYYYLIIIEITLFVFIGLDPVFLKLNILILTPSLLFIENKIGYYYYENINEYILCNKKQFVCKGDYERYKENNNIQGDIEEWDEN